MKHALITGGAGFIGSHLIDFLLKEGNWKVTCIDNFDNFYDPESKRNNIKKSLTSSNFKLVIGDICNQEFLENQLNENYDVIVHLAAKAGVRPSILNPSLYEKVNVAGTLNMLEFAKQKEIKQFVFASSSSVYGINSNVPWSEKDAVLCPISPYAATKVAGELLGHTYSHLYGIRFLALRFFTVFGPRQRPDLAIHKFVKSIINDQPIPFYGDGSTRRDYTFVEDIVSGIGAAMDYSKTNYEIINIGNNKSISLSELLSAIEEVIEKKALINFLPEQTGDVPLTYANIEKAQSFLHYLPQTSLKDGLHRFKEWYLSSNQSIRNP